MSIHPHSLRTASPPPKVQHFEREGGEGIGSWYGIRVQEGVWEI